jgi:uncharacterized repeat protein (TIGR02543 family)
MWTSYIKKDGVWQTIDYGPVYRKENGKWVKHEGNSLDGKKYLCQYMPTDLVTLGDSIPAGHMITDDWGGEGNQYGVNGNKETVIITNCYTDLIQRELKATYGNGMVTAKSFARSGDKVEDLIAKLRDAAKPYMRNAIANANLVIVCIGANNVLGPALNSIESYINNGTPTLAALDTTINNNMNVLSNNANANSYRALFDELYKANPNAKFVFTNIYNPLKYLWLDESTRGNDYKDGFFGPLMWAIPDLWFGWDNDIRSKLYNTDIVKKIFDRVNGVSRNGSDGLAAYTEKWVGQLNMVLSQEIAEFNNPNFIVADVKSVFDSFPDRPVSAPVHYNDLVNVEFTSGYKVENMDWGRFWKNIDWGEIVSNPGNIMNTAIKTVVSEVIVPDIDPHPETTGHSVIHRAIADALGWETLPRYTITFNANGGTGSMGSREVVAVDNLAAYTKLPINAFSHPTAGYRFIGWNTSPNGSGTSYSNGQLIGLTGNITLYAQWSNKYTVVYKHSKYAPGYDNSHTGSMECYELWVAEPGKAGVKYDPLGAFSNPAITYSFPYGTRIGIVVRDKNGEGHSYVKVNGTEVTGHSNDSRYEFTLTTHTDINFEWNRWAESVGWDDYDLFTNYWNCYITTY